MLPWTLVNRTRPPTGRGGHDLVGAEPVEDHGVEAAPALDDVGAVALVPDEGVVALVEKGRVGALIAVDKVVAATADEDLRATSAGERVVAVPAVDPCRLGGREHAVGLVDPDGVGAIAGRDVDGLERAAVEREVGRAIVADVDLEEVRIAGAQAERDLVR